jgi:enoyl-CoA hydratase/carnithine racemase
VPGWGGTQRLVEAIGAARAKEVVLGRRILQASTALEWGLVSQCVGLDELESAVDELAERILTGGPIAIQIAKQMIHAAQAGVASRILEPFAGALAATTGEITEGVLTFRKQRAGKLPSEARDRDDEHS